MPYLTTSLCRLLATEAPIVQAPIGAASCPALAAAVSNAGALGMLSITWRSPDETRRVIRATRQLTQRPFGVNLVLHWPPEERLRISLQEGVGIVSFFWGDPAPYVAQVHAAGALVMHTVTSAVEAQRAVTDGVDIIVTQGWEAGGHVWGQVGSLPLVPTVVDAVAPVPVIAAGGIADGRGLAAALTLGAAGAWLGSRFIASEESAVHAVYRERLLAARETDTAYSCLFDDGWPAAPHRTLRTQTVSDWELAGCPPPGLRPGEGDIVAAYPTGDPVRRFTGIMPEPGMSGDLDALAFYAGQSAGLIHDIRPAGEIVRSLVAEAVQALQRGSGFISP